MRTLSGLLTRRRTVQVQEMRAALSVDDRLGVDSIGRGYQATTARTFCLGHPVVVPIKVGDIISRSFFNKKFSVCSGAQIFLMAR